MYPETSQGGLKKKADPEKSSIISFGREGSNHILTRFLRKAERLAAPMNVQMIGRLEETQGKYFAWLVAFSSRYLVVFKSLKGSTTDYLFSTL